MPAGALRYPITSLTKREAVAKRDMVGYEVIEVVGNMGDMVVDFTQRLLDLGLYRKNSNVA